ncbi:hypothetical protein I2I11_20665 [Pontibacter sp. 172403-2]|nr:hypothetical protein [Pontibacter sp. 172403-2]MBF9255723.1 hypothetical protein [Pontibacter sp. 172403-2]
MFNSKGEILENTLADAPVKYLHGAGSIRPALEANLAGLTIGEEKEILISQEEGFAEADDDFRIEVIVDDIRWATAEELRAGQLIKKIKDENCGPAGCC